MGDRPVGFELLVLTRRSIALHEKKFRAQEPDAFSAQTDYLLCLSQAADIRYHIDGYAVAGDRRFFGVSEIALATLFDAFLRRANSRHFLGRRIEAERTLLSVQQHAGVIRNVQSGWLDSSEGRQA